MNGNDTRNESYRQLDLARRQREVLEVLCKRDLTNSELAKALKVDINRVTGRVKELRDKGFVVDKGKVFDAETNRMVHKWGLNIEDGQLALF